MCCNFNVLLTEKSANKRFPRSVYRVLQKDEKGRANQTKNTEIQFIANPMLHMEFFSLVMNTHTL